LKIAQIVNVVLTLLAGLLLYSHYAMGPTILGNVLVLMLSGFLCLCNVVLSLVLLPKARVKLLPLGNLLLVVLIFVFVFYLFYTGQVPAGYGP
jgi:hypothetical protein